MTRWRALGFAASGLFVAIALSVGVLLWYYRPTIEYAYVDTLDFRERPASWYVLVGAAIALALGSAAIWWRLKGRRGDKNGR